MILDLMHPSESACLFSAIEDFLQDQSRQAEARSCRSFWAARPRITAVEVDMLMALTEGPLCLEALALRLGRDQACTLQLLDALLAIGILERDGERYANSEAATLYCRSLRGDRPAAE